MLVNMRCVIIQDYAVLIMKHKRSHFIITHIPEIFESAVFIDYSRKISMHMAEQDTKNDMRVDVILPGVLGKFDDQLKATKKILTEVIKGAAENRVSKGEIKTVVTDSITKFTNYVGKY